MFNNLETPVLSAIDRALNGAYSRHMRILDNIANIDTPGHSFSDVRFKDYLAGLSMNNGQFQTNLLRTDGRHIQETKPDEMDAVPSTTYRETTIEQEMMNLTETTLFFNAMVQLRALNSGLIRTAIFEGRK
jgi:flagellar basal-body rod protein FlgB